GEYTVRAVALPENLPAAVGQAFQSDKNSVSQGGMRDAQKAMPVQEASQAGKPDLQELARKIDAVQRQVYESEKRLRFREILGGIGLSVGVAGVAFYLKARRR